MEREISVELTEMTDQSRPPQICPRIFRSDQTVPFDVPWTEIAGILGWMEGAKSLSCQGRPYQISVIGETVNFVKIDKVNTPESVIIDWL